MNLLLTSTELPNVNGMEVHSDSRRYATVTGDSEVLAELAYSEDVEWIEPKIMYQIHNDEADAARCGDGHESDSNPDIADRY